jgi:hypothetical protein
VIVVGTAFDGFWPLSETAHKCANLDGKRGAINGQFRIYFDQWADAKRPKHRLLDKRAEERRLRVPLIAVARMTGARQKSCRRHGRRANAMDFDELPRQRGQPRHRRS